MRDHGEEGGKTVGRALAMRASHTTHPALMSATHGKGHTMSTVNFAEMQAQATRQSMKAAKELDLLPEMSKVAVELQRGKVARNYYRWVATVHPIVKGGHTAYVGLNEFIGAVYQSAYPHKGAKLTTAQSERFEDCRTHFNNSLRAGRNLLGLKTVKGDTSTTFDSEKYAARIIGKLADVSLKDAVAVSNLIRDAVQERQDKASSRKSRKGTPTVKTSSPTSSPTPETTPETKAA